MAKVKKKNTDELRNSKIKDAMEIAQFAGKPTYFFSVGDRVLYGAVPETTIQEVINDGMVYRILCQDKKSDKDSRIPEEQYVPWINIRPYKKGETNFSCNEDIRLSYSNTTVESLLFKHLHFGVDFDPDYQRGYVWDDDDREKLITSIFMGVDIGRFVLRHLDGNEWMEKGIGYEIIDGKQRFLTLLAFYENRFPYKGVYYNDLSPRDKRCFKNATTAVAEVRNISKKETIRIFLLLNRSGKLVNDEVIKRAEILYNQYDASDESFERIGNPDVGKLCNEEEDNEVTPYNFDYHGVHCFAVQWGMNPKRFFFSIGKKKYEFIQPFYIEASADTDHIRVCIDLFLNSLKDKMLSEMSSTEN